ncbi:NPCBM/NEW2 domain-containing protein [Streptomyces sp. NPDC058583]|uniref:NPCBM/NEW2 domain-containing protein n=1 Tax=unclassified Streptomyces TaxID=2593676 RepID=UPI00365CF627
MSVYLGDVEPLTSTRGVDVGAAEVNGKGYARSVTLWVNQAGPFSELEYNLGRDWKSFKATVGLRDDSPSGGNVTFEVAVDGRTVYTKTVALGQTQEVNVDAQDALRLKLTVTYSGEDATSDYYGTWGDARLEH